MNTVYKPAIVVAGYNRKDSLKRVLYSLKEATYTENDISLIISLDKSNKTPDLLALAEDFKWDYGEKRIRVFDFRQGLRKHIISCGDLSFQYGSIIMLEDDVVVGKDFYQYVKEALKFYEYDEKIAGIALYSHKYNGYAGKRFEPIHNGYDTFLGQFSITWGQCWTSQQWKNFKNWYEKNNQSLVERDDIPHQIPNWPESSWGKYFVYYIVNNDKYYVIPYEAHSTCFSDIGQHTGKSDSLNQVPITLGKRKYNFASYEVAEKYDIYMENIDLERFLGGDYKKNTVCSNIFGQKPSFLGKRYMLTMKQLDYEILQSFALKMYPPELNIVYRILGSDIFLYDSTHKCKNDFKKQKIRIHNYEMRELKNYKEVFYFLLKYIVEKSIKKLKQVVMKLF